AARLVERAGHAAPGPHVGRIARDHAPVLDDGVLALAHRVETFGQLVLQHGVVAELLATAPQDRDRLVGLEEHLMFDPGDRDVDLTELGPRLHLAATHRDQVLLERLYIAFPGLILAEKTLVATRDLANGALDDH